MSVRLDTRWLLIGLVLLIAASQALASVAAPATPVSAAGKVLGHAGFAYLGVFRTYAAAVLWNRLDPVFHDYYNGVPMRDQGHIMPTIYMVQALDPQLEQPYYLGAYLLAAREDFDQARSLAQLGVEQNPKSGLLRANHIQILLMEDPKKNLAEMEREAEAGLREDMYWSSAEDFYEGLAIFRSVYRQNGDKVAEERIQAAMDKLSGDIDVGDHDHDGDGEQDH